MLKNLPLLSMFKVFKEENEIYLFLKVNWCDVLNHLT